MTDLYTSLAQIKGDLAKGKVSVEKLVNGLWNDPQKGMQAKALFKEKYPEAVLPEVDAFMGSG